MSKVEKLEYIVRSLSKGTTKKCETYIVNSIFNKLNSFYEVNF